MLSNFQIRKDSTLPSLNVTITKNGMVPLYLDQKNQCPAQSIDPNAVDLTGVTPDKITVEMVKCGRPMVKVIPTGSVTIVDAKSGEIEYNFSAQDTSIEGTYYFTFKIDFGSGKTYSWPLMRESLSVEVM